MDLYPRKPIADKAGQLLAPTLGDHLVPIPPYYYCQIQWGMGLLGKERSLFGVWCPAGQTRSLPFVGMGDQFASEPQPYRVLRHAVVEPVGGSRIVEDTVATKHGMIQLTDVPFDRTFFEWMLTLVEAFWRDRYVPAVFKAEAQRVEEASGAAVEEASGAAVEVEVAAGSVGAAAEFGAAEKEAAIAQFAKTEVAKAEAAITQFAKAEIAKAEAAIAQFAKTVT